MRIKHWAGYGCVNAKRINDGQATLHVRVEGDHEMGVKRDVWDDSLLYSWLVKRFDPQMQSYETWSRSRPLIDCTTDFRMDPKRGYTEIVDYYFHYDR